MERNGKPGKRMLHGNICTSEKIDKLSAEEERLYTRLLTQLDDFGNHPADPEMIRRACFPLKKRWNNWSVQGWLNKIVAVGLASYYETEDHRYIHFERFGDFQTLKYQNAWYPRPSDDRGGHPPMSGMVIDDDRGGHQGIRSAQRIASAIAATVAGTRAPLSYCASLRAAKIEAATKRMRLRPSLMGA